MSVDVRSRARKVLNVPADAAAAAATQAFLRTLPAADFAPSQESVAALNALAGLALPIESGAQPSLREEVEEFAGRYWSLAPSERLAQWLTLSARRPDDRTAERLLALKAGLELPGTPVPDERMEEVLSLARELFLLPPRQRSVRRNEWLLVNAGRHAELIAIAETIQRDQPRMIGLEPALFSGLSSRFKMRTFAEAAHAETLPADSLAPRSPVGDRSPSRFEYDTARKPRPTRAPASSPKSGWQLGWGAVVGIVVLLKVLGALVSSDRSRTPTYTPSNYHQPPFYPTTTPSVPEQNPKTNSLVYFFNSWEVNEFLNYEMNKSGRKPTRYDEWIKAKRPKPDQVVIVSGELDTHSKWPITDGLSPDRQKKN